MILGPIKVVPYGAYLMAYLNTAFGAVFYFFCANVEPYKIFLPIWIFILGTCLNFVFWGFVWVGPFGIHLNCKTLIGYFWILGVRATCWKQSHCMPINNIKIKCLFTIFYSHNMPWLTMISNVFSYGICICICFTDVQ